MHDPNRCSARTGLLTRFVGPGFAKWWAADVSDAGNTVDLGFFNRNTVYTLQRIGVARPHEVEWLCRTGKEWENTHLLFLVAPNKDQTVLRFTHADWREESEYFLNCNTTWGALMYRLKAAAESGVSRPLFTAEGMDLAGKGKATAKY